MSESLKEYCIRYDRRELLIQWHPDKNGDLTPDKITSGSQRKVWWRCDQGHEWQAKISDRATKRSDCPYCSNRKVLAGFNDLKTVEPLVAAPMAPGKKCTAGAKYGASQKHETGLVALQRRPRMESGGLFPDRCPEMRLPGLRGESPCVYK